MLNSFYSWFKKSVFPSVFSSHFSATLRLMFTGCFDCIHEFVHWVRWKKSWKPPNYHEIHEYEYLNVLLHRVRKESSMTRLPVHVSVLWATINKLFTCFDSTFCFFFYSTRKIPLKQKPFLGRPDDGQQQVTKMTQLNTGSNNMQAKINKQIKKFHKILLKLRNYNKSIRNSSML